MQPLVLDVKRSHSVLAYIQTVGLALVSLSLVAVPLRRVRTGTPQAD
jgi:hypothetical protein